MSDETRELGIGLERVAAELGAQMLALLIVDGASVEVAYHTGGTSIACGAEVRAVLLEGLEAEQVFKPAVVPEMNSFLLYRWQARREGVVAVVCGFLAQAPGALPKAIEETLGLVALAAWSVKEVNRLRAELRVMADRLAGRKMVERAKGLLQAERGMSEQQAYEYLRKMSRQRRITMAKLAEDSLLRPAILCSESPGLRQGLSESPGLTPGARISGGAIAGILPSG